ncbi:MAG TPA: amino acid permease [Candidatus Acidoferrales bacterium]|nr:amino acid permease [Candidatus Acidoferrales bacterium]
MDVFAAKCRSRLMKNLRNSETSFIGGNAAPRLAAKLGLFDATMIVMGGIVGSGIFINPYVVAQQVYTPALILGAWVIGGVIALGGAFIWAELAAVMPRVGGQYAYLREAYHPAVAFLYGWVLLLVIQTGGMAAVAVTFAKYFVELTACHLNGGLIATLTLGILTVINCLGVRAGSTVQSALMVLKILAIAALVFCGGVFLAHHLQLLHRPIGAPLSVNYRFADQPVSFGLLTAMGAALVPVLFSYGGWQTANFVAEEVREPRKNLPRALVIGVVGVILLYLSVNFVCVYVLGPTGLARTMTPASAVMRVVWGSKGAALIAVGITISALGFLSQSILTAPRVYFAMAEDGLFFRAVGWLDPRHRVPVFAIALQGVAAIVIALSGRYDQILSYVVSMDFLFFGLTATCIFVFRRAGKATQEATGSSGLARMPGHPVTTFIFVAVCWLVVLNTIFRYPRNTAVGFAILFAGIPVYFLWGRQKKKRSVGT